MRDLEWMDYASCAEVVPDLFFVEPNQRADAELAKQFCRRCPVRKQCLEYAVANKFVDGIWGGTTGNERARIWRAKKSEK